MVWASACGGGGSGGPPPPPIDRNTPVAMASMTQYAELCDWTAAELGGYGRSMDCGGGVSVSTYPNQQACLSQPIASTCTATVGQYEDCVAGLAGAGSLCSLASSPPAACNPLFAMCATAFGG